jgi:DNA invertase Pin-like site-specific DNA recombinase
MSTANETKRAIGYIRFSSDDQGNGSTIERQTANIQAYCDRTDLNLIATVIDEGKSASKGAHLKANLGKFLAEADTGNHAGRALVVEELDRLSRLGINETAALIQRILKAGLEVHITQTGRIISPREDMATSILNVVESFAASEYSRRLKERSLKASSLKREALLNKGETLTALLPAWLKKGANCKPVKVTEAEGTGKMRKVPASTVKRIFELASEGLGARKILEKLNGSANGLSPVWVQKTLRNRATIGEFRSAKIAEPVFGYYPAVVDAALFESVQIAMDSRNREDSATRRMRCVLGGSDSNNLFTGVAWDVTAGTFSMNRQGRYFLTHTRAGRGNIHTMRYATFERAFLQFVAELDWHSVIAKGTPQELTIALAEQNELTNTVVTLKSQIASKELAMESADAAASVVLARVAASLGAKLEAAETSLKAARATVDSIKSKLATLESPARLLELLRETDNADIRRKLKSEISRRVSAINLDFSHTKLNPVKSVEVEIEFVNGVLCWMAIELATGEILGRARFSE